MTEFRPRIATPDVRLARRSAMVLLALAIIALMIVSWLLLWTDDGVESDRPFRSDASLPASASQSAAPVVARPADLPPPEPYKPDPAGRAMLDQLKLAPAQAASGGAGYVVTKADAELLAATPLREGDVLLELDGQKLDPARIERLADELGDYDDVWITFERDGKKIGTLLELRRR